MYTPRKINNREGQNLFLNPNYIIGFIDGEGCFSITIHPRSDCKERCEIRPAFEIEVSIDDKDLMEKIYRSLGMAGQLYVLNYKRYKKWKPHVKIKVSNLKDLTEKIIPFFRKYPLQSKKRKSFEIFCKIVAMIEKKKHLSKEGVEKIVRLRESMNPKGKGFRKKRTRLVREIRSLSGNSK
ncbi:MAG: hypothetical protein FD151_2391 [bacterium]|nr:MAG: hypothetical protein FD151_2391 [bacterium]